MQLAQLPQETHLLPGRFGPRPRTSTGLPFRQLDQLPAPEMIARLANLCGDLPGVRVRESRMAAPGTFALAVDDRAARGPAQAFIDGNEFCHLHPAPHGSIHLTLPVQAVEGIVALGWAERHPIYTLGVMKSLVLIYGPRTREELEVTLSLIEHSCSYAKGLAGAAAMAMAGSYHLL
jgi:hypothetical protein